VKTIKLKTIKLSARPLSPVKGALLIGIVAVLMNAVYRAWGMAASIRIADLFVLRSLNIQGYSPFWSRVYDLYFVETDPGLFVLAFFFILGSFTAALLAGEFKVRKIPKSKIPQAIAGGLLMGIGITLSGECNVAVFLRGVPSLAVGGYLTLTGMVIGFIAGSLFIKWQLRGEC
jgi:uncharacterized membrane protein YedE/YeeE